MKAAGTELKPINFKVLGAPLNKLLTAIGNKLSREWPSKYRSVTGARELFVMHLRAAHKALLSALYLCGDLPPDPRREAEFSVSLAPINRALLDSLFTILFVLEDVPARCQWFNEAGWREARLELDRYIAEYGTLPEWQDWLSDLTRFVATGVSLYSLTPEQTSDPRALRSWLTAGNMCNYGVSPTNPLDATKAFMKYLNDGFYIDLSQQVHLTAWGTMKRTGFLLDELRMDPSTEAQIKKYRYYQIGQTVVFALAIAAEIEAHFDFGLRQDALYVWSLAASLIVIGDEMYRKRYEELLKGY